jgi:CO/xanthine dehydrogenase Mo-binding subunit/aerobic-type carbon monoxide dehydrogenase small subunit (CoxS/CutS family)
MADTITLKVNGAEHQVRVEAETPLLYVLRNDLKLKGPKYGCGLEQCGACKVIIDGQAVPSCQMPVKNVQGLEIITIEGLGTADNLHPLQEAFMQEQAIQCGYCVTGMIMAAQGLLNRVRYPSDDDIREALADNLCRCGVYDRVRRAIKLRIGRPSWEPIYTITERDTPLLPDRPESLPQPLRHTPDIDAWLRLNPDETVTLFSGKVELGQGLKTALAQIGAEELDVSLERIRVVMADTAQTPDENMTTGSMSLETSGNAIRYAAAEARHILLSLAAEEFEVLLETLAVTDGTITEPASGRQISYWQLFGGQRFATRVTSIVQPKAPETYRVVGQPVTRLDLLPKVTGQAYYVHDLELPDMVHGRVIRPPHYNATLVTVNNEAAVAQLPGVLKVVRDGSFLAVIAEREDQVIRAMELLQANAVWQGEAQLPAQETLLEKLLNQPEQPFLVVEGTPVSEPIPAIAEPPAGTAQSLAATYFRPYHMHASLGPSAAVAQLEAGKLTIWSPAQGVFPPRAVIAQVLGMAEADIRVIHQEGAGCYGHNGADDATLDAALLALALPGRPVSLKWMRADEHGWEPYGPAMALGMQASLNANGEIIDWNQDIWSYPHGGRPRPDGTTSGLLAAWHLAEPFPRPQPQPPMATHVGGHRNGDPLYALPRRRIVSHFVPDSPLRTSSQRGLGAYGNVFAIESFMDELAHAAGLDPVEFRLRHLADERARAVIEAAAAKAGWPREKAQDHGNLSPGRGLAFARYKNRQCYAAVVVDLKVDRSSGHIQLQRVVIAADAGQIINPDGLSNQLEGGVIQAASWTLKEEVRFDPSGITSRDWQSYPILTFPDAPIIETVLLNRPGQPHMGSGEATQGPTPAAIANAVFDAAAIRLRTIPFTPDRVRAALSERGA